MIVESESPRIKANRDFLWKYDHSGLRLVTETGMKVADIEREHAEKIEGEIVVERRVFISVFVSLHLVKYQRDIIAVYAVHHKSSHLLGELFRLA